MCFEHSVPVAISSFQGQQLLCYLYVTYRGFWIYLCHGTALTATYLKPKLTKHWYPKHAAVKALGRKGIFCSQLFCRTAPQHREAFQSSRLAGHSVMLTPPSCFPGTNSFCVQNCTTKKPFAAILVQEPVQTLPKKRL